MSDARGVTEGTSRPRLALAILSLVLFVTFLDNTVVASALANLQSDLRAGVTALQWVVSSYALAFAALMLPFGTLSDRLGRRAVMVAGLALFSAGSVLAAVAPTSGVLIGARAIMGIGAAASEPGTLSMIRQLYPDPTDRGRALGVWGAVSGLALAAGPVVGGVLVGLWSWRAIFVFNVLLGVAAIAGVVAILPESRGSRPGRFDAPGALLGAVALTAGTSATIAGETAGYATWWVAGLYAIAGAAVVGFVAAERRGAEPVLDVSFFRQGGFVAGNLMAFSGYFATFSVFFFIPLFVQLLGGASPYRVAVDFLPMAAAMIVVSAISGRWVAEVGPGIPIAVGTAVAGAGILVTDAMVTPTSGPRLFGWSLVLVGAGLAVLMVAATVAVLGAVPALRSGMAASAVNTSRELGAVAGVAVLGAIVNAQLTTDLLHRLAAIPGLPAAFRGEVVAAVITGTAGTRASSLPKSGPIAAIVHQVLLAAEKSFASGLDWVMLVAAVLLLASGVAATAVVRRSRATSLEQ